MIVIIFFMEERKGTECSVCGFIVWFMNDVFFRAIVIEEVITYTPLSSKY